MCKASASKKIPETHRVKEGLLVVLAPLKQGEHCARLQEACPEHGALPFPEGYAAPPNSTFVLIRTFQSRDSM